jgi:photosystem II stability/assembly factor-like uncharacterized protein
MLKHFLERWTRRFFCRSAASRGGSHGNRVYLLALWCLVLCAINLGGMMAWWLYSADWVPFTPYSGVRLAVGVITGGLVLVGTPIGIQLINTLERAENHEARAPSDLVNPWKIMPIKNADGNVEWSNEWRDIAWFTTPTGSRTDEAWLCGVVSWSGLGEGILLRTTDGGKVWRDVSSQIKSSPRSRVGYLQSLDFTSVQVGNSSMFEGTLAAADGIYRTRYSKNAEEGDITWKKLIPDRLEARVFNRLAFSANEIYAVGWTGMLHGSLRGETWEIEEPTMTYDIRSVSAYGNPPGIVWAVGRNSPDPGTSGAIYRRLTIGFWQREYISSAPLNDLVVVRGEFALVVGENGTMLRGTNLDKGLSHWESVKLKGMDENLRSISYDEKRDTLWVVGDNGVILRSEDGGNTWLRLPPTKIGARTPGLGRVRFFGGLGIILGHDIVLQYQ